MWRRSKDADRLREEGAFIRRVILDHELKHEYQQFLQERNRGKSEGDGRPDRTPEEIHRWAGTHRELSRLDLSPHVRLLRLGTRLWREGRRDRDIDDDQDATETDRRVSAWTPEVVHVSLEWLALRAALARRRAMWLTRLVDASVVWREPGAACARLMVIEGGEIVLSTDADPDRTPPVPLGYQRPLMARRGLFTVACFDRLRVLTTELKRLVATGAPVSLRFGLAPALADARLAAALWWV